MPLFLTPSEREAFHNYRRSHPIGQDIYWALLNRVEARAGMPQLQTDWWFSVAEFLTDAAMAHALKPSENVASWLRSQTLAMVRRPADDWVGPPFRNHAAKEPVGNLETGHLTWAVAIALDLARDVFTADEVSEIAGVLRERGIPMCRRWMDANDHLANWRCVLGAGIAVAAAVLDDKAEIERAVADYRMSLNIFQADGSYAESLQYSNYAAYTLMLAREALLRHDPSLDLPADPWNKLPRWQAASLFYQKPLSRWGASPRARCANFNDSAALFRPSGDLLLHLASHEAKTATREAGLARWLFDTLYAGEITQGPHDRAAFGFLNDWGFLAIPLLPNATDALDPAAAGLSKLEAFSCGDVLARDAWDGRTILAVHGGGDPLRGPGHLHGDLNSFILVHNRERLLVDPGHSCYRNLIHGLEGSSRTHNTCTFVLDGGDDLGLQEDKHDRKTLEQSRTARVRYDRATGEVGPLADRGSRRLIAERHEEVTVIGSEAAALYGSVIQEFSRFWILCGSHTLFVVDRIVSGRPVKTAWHWLLNNRDDALHLKTFASRCVVARRGNAGMKLFHLGTGNLGHPEHAYVHDAYDPSPGGNGEGQAGSGTLLTWREPAPLTERTVVHAICLDSYGCIGGWHLRDSDGKPMLESPCGKVQWKLDVSADAAEIKITEAVAGRSWTARKNDDAWNLTSLI